MSTYNTTYNFNQGNMNFGQALLYGAFGSLTGGMGCFGGGYGMGMMSPFGMGGSLFSMMGMGGYGMGYGCDSMIGAQVGMSMANLAYGAISQAIEGRGGSGSEKSISDKLADVKSNAKTHLEILNKDNGTYTLNSDLTNIKNEIFAEGNKYQKAIDEANENIEQAKVELRESTSDLESHNGKEPKKTDSKYQKPKAGSTTGETEFDEAKYDEDWKKWNTKKLELKEKVTELENSIKETGELGKALAKAKQDKINRETEVDNAIKALQPLKEDFNKLKEQEKAEHDAEILDEADGNWLNRASKSSIKNYDGKSEATKSQIRGAFNQFIKAKKAGKPAAQKEFAQILKNMKEHSPINFKDFEDAYNTLKIDDEAN